MTKGDLIGQYKTMSAEDRCTFERWIKFNLAAGCLIVAGLLFMAFGGPDLFTPSEAVAKSKAATESAAPVPGRAMSPFDLMIRIAPDGLPIEQVDQPF
jgi:hypothetical protein